MRISPGPRPALWTSWAGTARCQPRVQAVPGSTDELRALLDDAASRGEGVRVVGAGHSFTGAATTSGTMVDLADLGRRPVRAGAEAGAEAGGGTARGGYDGRARRARPGGPGGRAGRAEPEGFEAVVPLPDGGALVTVRAGIGLRSLNLSLALHGLALPNLGDIDRQTLAGALGTGTHGTGVRLPGLAAQVHGLRVMTASGEVVETSAERHRPLFESARLGLGAVGIVLAVTLRTVPAFRLTAREEPQPLDAVLEQLDGPGNLVDAHDHLELYWFPHTRHALTKRNDRAGPGEEPRAARRLWGAGRRWVDDELLSNGAFWLTNELATLAPRLTPRINAVASRALAPRTYTAASYEVFVSPRRVRFAEMEYAVPRGDVVEVLREIDRWVESSQVHVPFPVEVRFAAADDVWLSTAHARETAYVAVHQYVRMPHDRYFAGVEAIVRAAQGRPHWGKLHTLDQEALGALYPRLDDFCAVRDAYDPGRLFANPYTTRLFG